MIEERTGTLKFVSEAGLLIRGPFRSFIKNLAFTRNLKLELEEDKHILHSSFRVKLTGLESDLQYANKKLNEFLIAYGE